nr:uncharacterized protein LOC105491913 [Macaca nemestrina]
MWWMQEMAPCPAVHLGVRGPRVQLKAQESSGPASRDRRGDPRALCPAAGTGVLGPCVQLCSWESAGPVSSCRRGSPRALCPAAGTGVLGPCVQLCSWESAGPVSSCRRGSPPAQCPAAAINSIAAFLWLAWAAVWGVPLPPCWGSPVPPNGPPEYSSALQNPKSRGLPAAGLRGAASRTKRGWKRPVAQPKPSRARDYRRYKEWPKHKKSLFLIDLPDPCKAPTSPDG